MFDSLLGSKFSNKCKHSVKCIRCRMETIRKKKQAMVRYLKKDVADLITAGHDSIAFGRMDALLSEINQEYCYDMIEQHCCCILEHLSTMQKERACPKETLEAVATLIFSAARFSDLPELADLRRGFTDRFGTNLESYASREFVEKLQQRSFSQHMKLELMKEIALEYNILWNVKGFQYKLSVLPNVMRDDRGEATYRNEAVNGRKLALEDAEDAAYLARDARKQREEIEKPKVVISDEDRKVTRRSVQNHQAQPAECDLVGNIKKTAATREAENIESCCFDKRAPPYTKPKGDPNANSMHEQKFGENIRQSSEFRAAPHDKSIKCFDGVGSTAEEVVEETELAGQQRKPIGAVQHPESNRASNTRPPYVKPNVKSSMNTAFSVRRRPKQETFAEAAVATAAHNDEDVSLIGKDSVPRIHRPFREPAHGMAADPQTKLVYDSSRTQNPEPHVKGQLRVEFSAHTPSRTVSLPTAETVARVHVRSVSMQPELVGPNGGRLPDYNELAARLSALRRP